MNKNVKDILKSAAESPDSIRKDVFIRECRKKYISRKDGMSFVQTLRSKESYQCEGRYGRDGCDGGGE